MQPAPTWAASPLRPHSPRKAWWRSGMCKNRQPHRWQASIQHCTWQELPLQHWQCSLPLQQSGSQPPRGGSRVGLGHPRGVDIRDSGSKQPLHSNLEVWRLWAQTEHHCESQNIKRDRMSSVWARS